MLMTLDTRYPAYFFHRDGSLKLVTSIEEEDALDKSVWKHRAWAAEDDAPPELEATAPAAIEPDDDLPDTLDEYTVKESEALLLRPGVTQAHVQKWLDHEHDGKGRLGLIALLKAKLPS